LWGPGPRALPGAQSSLRLAPTHARGDHLGDFDSPDPTASRTAHCASTHRARPRATIGRACQVRDQSRTGRLPLPAMGHRRPRYGSPLVLGSPILRRGCSLSPPKICSGPCQALHSTVASSCHGCAVGAHSSIYRDEIMYAHRAQSTEHRAQSTGHRAQGTEHGARSTEHGARSTEHGARSTEHGAQGMEHRAWSTGHGA